MLEYQIVPDVYRERTTRKKMRRNHSETDDPIIQELFKGKTVLVDAHVPLAEKYKNGVYKNLYNYLANRGYRLFMYQFDDLDLGIFRGLLMWIEPFSQAWFCSRCRRVAFGSVTSKPSSRDCESVYKYHSWNKVKDRLPEDAIIEVEETAA